MASLGRFLLEFFLYIYLLPDSKCEKTEFTGPADGKSCPVNYALYVLLVDLPSFYLTFFRGRCFSL